MERNRNVPLAPSPETPLVKLSNQLILAWASLTTIGCPSCSTLCTVIRALKVWTSSARIGCLQARSRVLLAQCDSKTSSGDSTKSSFCRPTLSCLPRRTVRIYGPMCTQWRRGHVFLNKCELEVWFRRGVCEASTFRSSFLYRGRSG